MVSWRTRSWRSASGTIRVGEGRYSHIVVELGMGWHALEDEDRLGVEHGV